MFMQKFAAKILLACQIANFSTILTHSVSGKNHFHSRKGDFSSYFAVYLQDLEKKGGNRKMKSIDFVREFCGVPA